MRVGHGQYQNQQPEAGQTNRASASRPPFSPSTTAPPKRESRAKGRRKQAKPVSSQKVSREIPGDIGGLQPLNPNRNYGSAADAEYFETPVQPPPPYKTYMDESSRPPRQNFAAGLKRGQHQKHEKKHGKKYGASFWQRFVPGPAAGPEIAPELLWQQEPGTEDSGAGSKKKPLFGRQNQPDKDFADRFAGLDKQQVSQPDRYKELDELAAAPVIQPPEEMAQPAVHASSQPSSRRLSLRHIRGAKSFQAFRVEQHRDKHEQASAEIHSIYSELTRDYSHPELSEAYNKELNEGFWEILASFSLWLLHVLRLDGLLFVVQLLIFSLLVQHYLPPLSRYYFDQSASVQILPEEDNLDKLLNEDILLTDAEQKQSGIGGGETLLTVELAAVSALPGLNSGGEDEALSPAKVQAILNPAYKTSEYTVKSGESISLLAQRYQINMSTLISVNQIERAKSLRAGQKILISNMDGLLYQVQPKDTLEGIAKQYDTTIGNLIDANELQSEKLVAGTQLFVPGATLSSYELRKVFGNLYIYPFHGRLSSKFGYRSNPFQPGRREFHNGLDIVGPRGAAIKASSDGRVVAAGYHTIYGNYVILQHAKGIKTLYGHMSKILVSKGQKIIQGQTIGRIGSSGRSTGRHVHFSIFVGGKAVNPQDYLSGP